MAIAFLHSTYGTPFKKPIKDLNEHACFGVRRFYNLELFDYVVLRYPF